MERVWKKSGESLEKSGESLEISGESLKKSGESLEKCGESLEKKLVRLPILRKMERVSKNGETLGMERLSPFPESLHFILFKV